MTSPIVCTAVQPGPRGYECTLPAGHAGMHEAHGAAFAGPYAVWANASFSFTAVPRDTPGALHIPSLGESYVRDREATKVRDLVDDVTKYRELYEKFRKRYVVLRRLVENHETPDSSELRAVKAGRDVLSSAVVRLKRELFGERLAHGKTRDQLQLLQRDTIAQVAVLDKVIDEKSQIIASLRSDRAVVGEAFTRTDEALKSSVADMAKMREQIAVLECQLAMERQSHAVTKGQLANDRDETKRVVVVSIKQIIDRAIQDVVRRMP